MRGSNADAPKLFQDNVAGAEASNCRRHGGCNDFVRAEDVCNRGLVINAVRHAAHGRHLPGKRLQAPEGRRRIERFQGKDRDVERTARQCIFEGGCDFKSIGGQDGRGCALAPAVERQIEVQPSAPKGFSNRRLLKKHKLFAGQRERTANVRTQGACTE